MNVRYPKLILAMFAVLLAATTAVAAPDPDVLEKTAYVITNPVTAGLVSSWDKWPGALSRPRQHESGGKTIQRPTLFFSADGCVPERVTLRLTRPHGWRDLTDTEYGDALRDRVNEREAEIRAAIKRKGGRFLGAKAVKNAPRTQTAASQREALGRTDPTVAAHDRWARIEKLQENEAFLTAYREAWSEYCGGSKDVVFPMGTWLMRVRYHVSCAGPP